MTVMEPGVIEADLLAINLNEFWHLGADKANSEVVVHRTSCKDGYKAGKSQY